MYFLISGLCLILFLDLLSRLYRGQRKLRIFNTKHPDVALWQHKMPEIQYAHIVRSGRALEVYFDAGVILLSFLALFYLLEAFIFVPMAAIGLFLILVGELRYTCRFGVIFSQSVLVLSACAGTFLVFEGALSVFVLLMSLLIFSVLLQSVEHIVSFYLQKSACVQVPQIQHRVHSIYQGMGHVEIQNVSFHHSGRDEQILDQVNFSVPPKTMITISGEEKECQTLLEVLSGLHHTEGRVLLDGIDALLYPAEEKRSYIGFISSDPVLFYDDILDNITMLDQALEEEAKRMMRLLKLDHIEGKTLTRDIRQRIAIARALVGHPKLLLCEDLGDSLKRESYNLFFKILGQLQGRTTIVLATEDRNLRYLADAEYVLQDGVLIKRVGLHDSKIYAVQPYQELRI